MKRKLIFFILLIANLSLSNFAYSSRVKNGFEALQIKDYFKARKLFTKSLKYNPSPAGFGLATIYSRNDNPFYNIDSAYRYILISDSTWQEAKQRKKEKWAHYGWTKNGVDSLKIRISSQFYILALKKHTVENYTQFLQNHPWAKEYSKALYSRDSLAFHQAVATNTSASYKNYMDTYPQSEFYEIAKQNYFHAQFIEFTGDGSLDSYKKFVAKFPNSPLRYEADSMIYLFVTEPNDFDSYKDFVENYKQNSLIQKGWREFYQVFLFDYSKERMREFLKLYPEAPNKKEIEEDILWYDSILLPYMIENKYGLMNEYGQIILSPDYAFLSENFDGLFLYGQAQKLGLLNRKGEIICLANYDAISYLSNGRFVVEKKDSLGLIDRKGRVLLPCEYDDIGGLSNDLVYVSKNEKYYYTDYNGKIKIDSSFVDATDFRNDYAIVETNNAKALINSKGKIILVGDSERLKWLNDSLLGFVENNQWGVVSVNNDTILKPNYDYIGAFRENLAIASKNDTLIYLNLGGKNQFNQFFSTFPNYKVKGDFYNSTAIINRDGLYGRINKNGDIITDVEYENLALGVKFIPFEKGGLWGILSLSNKEVVSPTFNRIDLVGEKYAIAYQEDSVGVVGVDGKVIVPFKYQKIHYLTENCFRVFDGNKYGLYRRNQLLTGLEFDLIELYDKEFVSLTNEKGVFYYDLNKNKIIKPQIGLE